jgi:hypothetical protein
MIEVQTREPCAAKLSAARDIRDSDSPWQLQQL